MFLLRRLSDLGRLFPYESLAGEGNSWFWFSNLGSSATNHAPDYGTTCLNVASPMQNLKGIAVSGDIAWSASKAISRS